SPDNDGTLYEYVSGGDILKLHRVNGAFIMENNGMSGEPTSTGQNNGQGPGGGEFVFEDAYIDPGGDAHNEVFFGGIGVLSGSGEFVISRMDPEDLNSGGIGWYSSTGGTVNSVLELYSDATPGNFAKSVGLGDVELLCLAAPIIIGNRLWEDSDGDGIQDPGEPGISNVTITLQIGTNIVVTTTAGDDPSTPWDETGTYYFNSLAGENAAGVLGPNTNGTLTVDLADPDLTGRTNITTGTAATNDEHDNDADLFGVVNFSTGDPGMNDYSFDVGVIAATTDLGDLPESEGYPTTTNNNGASHTVIAGVFLGANVDAELDGTPTLDATGDGSDEDGVVFPSLITGQDADLTVTASTAGFLNVFFDFDDDGTLELVVSNAALATGANLVTVSVPSNAVIGDIYSRFRFTTNSVAGPVPTGLLDNGEVEDYVQAVIETDHGDLPNLYQTTVASNGAQHIIVPGVYLGAGVDGEADGQPSANAQGDGADEDGVTLLDPFVPGQTVDVQVVASTGGFLNAFYDFNGDGMMTQVFTNEALAAGVNNLSLVLPGFLAGNVYSRYRFTTNSVGVPAVAGLQDNGEVEDYLTTSPPLDYGDLPMPYRTLVADNGAVHQIVSNVFLGASVDAETNGVPSGLADGDGGDEDGVIFPTLIANHSADLTITAGTGGFVNIFFDFDNNGVLELIGTNVAVSSGVNIVSIDVPANAAITNIYSRFRFTTNMVAGPAADGFLDNGEVEDYVSPVLAPVTIGNLVWIDENANGIQDAGETNGVPGVTVVLFDSMTNAVATNLPDAVGLYLFSNLAPGSYIVDFDETTLPAGFVTTLADQGGDDAVDSDGDISTPVLPSGTTNLTFDLGIYEPVAVGDYVWIDENGNGIQDVTETNGVLGVTVVLFDAMTNAIATNVTDASGLYLFTNLTPGVYFADVDTSTLPPGYVITFNDQGGDDAVDSDANPTNGMTPPTSFILSGTNDLTLDMGIYIPVAIGDYVWHDENGDGLQDGGETGVVGVTVVLFDSQTNAVATNVTDAAGLYLFTNLPPGSYMVDFDESTVPAGYVVTFLNQGTNDTVDSDGDVTAPFLPSGATNLTFDLGVYDPVEVGDFVWIDENGDGIQDAAETNGVSGVTVVLFDSMTNAVATNVTAAGGLYLFTNLPPGSYFADFDESTLPNGFVITFPNQGGDDEVDSDANPTDGVTAPTPFLVSGTNDLTL
ncbi:MAG: SdrD B-like domain-containing protein, partial [Verrucomicrobiota bacterium]